MSKGLTLEQVDATLADVNLKRIGEYRTVNDKMECQCVVCDATVTPRLANIRSRGDKVGCKYCATRKRATAITLSIEEVDRSLAAVDLRRTGPYQGALVKIECVCLLCGTDVGARISEARGKPKRGCGACSFQAKLTASRPTTDEARAGFLQANLKMVGTFVRTDRPVECVCLDCGGTVHPRLSTVRKGGGCEHCGRLASIASRTRKSSDVKKFLFDKGLLLDEGWTYTNSGTPIHGRHKSCGNTVKVSYNNVQRNGYVPCAYCAQHGYKYNRSSVLYLITNDDLGALKIGVMNLESKRLDSHQKNGWRVVETWEFEEGAEPQRIEQEVLAMWKDIRGFVSPADMPQNGSTETVSLEDVSEVDAYITIATLVEESTAAAAA